MLQNAFFFSYAPRTFKNIPRRWWDGLIPHCCLDAADFSKTHMCFQQMLRPRQRLNELFFESVFSFLLLSLGCRVSTKPSRRFFFKEASVDCTHRETQRRREKNPFSRACNFPSLLPPPGVPCGGVRPPRLPPWPRGGRGRTRTPQWSSSSSRSCW